MAVPSQAMPAEVNRDVQEASSKKKWGAYKRYSASVFAETRRYAIHHGVAAAARYFSKKLDSDVSEARVSYSILSLGTRLV